MKKNHPFGVFSLATSLVCVASLLSSCTTNLEPPPPPPGYSSSSIGEPSSSSFVAEVSSSSTAPSSSSVGIVYGSPVYYEGETYETVIIGTQTWFKRNLNYAASGMCYDNQASNCATYGRLYDWNTAKTVCPSGWHLPTQAEWNVLTAFIGGASTEGKYLKATSGWSSIGIGNGTDTYGFSALPGGLGFYGSDFNYVGISGYWWSASESNSYDAYSRYMNYYHEDAYWEYIDKSTLFSVRCLKD